MTRFLERLKQPQPLILDGATGTEIDRRGIETRLPLWSAGALETHPDVVRAIHVDYLHAGAEIITTNTFRTHAHNIGDQDKARELTIRAVELARQAIDEVGRFAFIAGSVAPLEDCYSPELTPDEAYCQQEHHRMIHTLAEGGVDFILIETMHTIYEACAAARAAHDLPIPFVVSFILGSDGRLLGGESLEDAVSAVTVYQPAAILLNCIPVAQIGTALRHLRRLTDLPIGAYGNMGSVDEITGWQPDESLTPERYCRAAKDWLELGAQIIGSCCGSTPAHIHAIQQEIVP